MLKLKPNSEVPNALFTWFISGTDSNYGIKPKFNFYYFINNQKRKYL